MKAINGIIDSARASPQRIVLSEGDDPLCFADLMVRLGHADGPASGAVRTTADMVRNAIQIIGVDKSFQLTSSFFLMMLCAPFHSLKSGLIFSDCGLVVDPDAEELSQIAIAAADSAHRLRIGERRIADVAAAPDHRYPTVDALPTLIRAPWHTPFI